MDYFLLPWQFFTLCITPLFVSSISIPHRVNWLRVWREPSNGGSIPWPCCALSLSSGISHTLFLSQDFDYTYNMAFNLLIGLAHNLLWVLYSLPSPLPSCGGSLHVQYLIVLLLSQRQLSLSPLLRRQWPSSCLIFHPGLGRLTRMHCGTSQLPQ